MRPTSELPRLSGALQYRVRRLVLLFRARPLAASATSEADRVVSYCTIELANAWLQFVRSYYLSCVVGARQGSGMRVRHSGSFATLNDALVQSAAIMGKRVRGKVPTPGEEPDWISPPTIIKLSRSLSFTNQGEIAAAFGITTSIFQPLTTCRNFYAHRSERAADKIENLSRSLAVPLQRRATVLLCSARPGGSHTIFEGWAGLIQAVGAAMSS